MDVGTFLFMLVMAYAFGVFWYSLLPARLNDAWWRVLAYPFALIALGEIVAPYGPAFGGLHYVTAFIAALIGVAIDWIVTVVRHPVAVHEAPSPATPAFTPRAA